MQWDISSGRDVIYSDVSPLYDYNGRLFDAAETLTIALEKWLIRQEFRAELARIASLEQK